MTSLNMGDSVPLKIYEILNAAVNGDIENYVIGECDCNKKGEGFSGQTIFVSLEDKEIGTRLYFVVKQAFPDQTSRKLHPVREVFVNEIHFYKKLCPKFLKFQENIPSEHHFVHLPKCLAATSDENYERLVLENLTYQGFLIHDKKKPLGKDEFEYIFKVYGKFHATSFAYRALHPEEFSKLSEGVIDVWRIYIESKIFQDGIKMLHEQCLDFLRPGADDEIIAKYKHYVDDGVDLVRKSLVSGRHTAILHGDCWSNNMMFKYDDSGNLTDLKLLDFQNVRLGSPVCDLSYCLYSGGTKETFDDLDHLLQVYHDSFSKNLKAHGCDPDELYPLQVLKDDWKVHSQLGLTFGLMLWRIKLTHDAAKVDISDFSDEEDIAKLLEAKCDTSAFLERARDIILHFYENNYLL